MAGSPSQGREATKGSARRGGPAHKPGGMRRSGNPCILSPGAPSGGRAAGKAPPPDPQDHRKPAMNRPSAVPFAGASRIHLGLEVKDVARSLAFFRVLLGVE